MPISLCNKMANLWYPGRKEKDWERPDADDTQDMFSRLGLDDEFWNLQ